MKNRVSNTRQKEIDQELDRLLLAIGKSYPENSLSDIVQAAIPGVRLHEDDFQDDSTIRGMIFQQSEEFSEPMIVIQKHLSAEAKTYALAHEFGHYVLNHAGPQNYYVDQMKFDGSAEMQKEAEAQYFAASLLMPKEKFTGLEPYLNEYDLAKRFGVSVSAVRVRKDWLHPSGNPSTA
ncbi:MAG TPA: ImmA/IrrE family metallo-endopeptidase [Candidatus Saccharimonadia bacterium]